MNIVFMGTPDFAVPSLKLLLNSGFKISAVVTAPDKPKGRGLTISSSPVKKFAIERNLLVLQPVELNSSDFINAIKSLKPDLAVVVAFRILPREIFSIPLYGTVNLHASLLPKYRGAAPINWAIINGEKITGVTTFFIEDRVDTGNIIMQRSCEINPDDDADSLHDKLAVLGAEVLKSTVTLISEHGGNIQLVKQDESLATTAPKIYRKDCLINLAQPAIRVYNFIRGLSPRPGAYTYLKGRMIKILRVKPSDIILDSEPGKFHLIKSGLYIACLDELLEVLLLQLEGRKIITAGEFISGYGDLV